MSQTASSTLPVVKERTVPLDRGEAFQLFTRRMGDWWPAAPPFSIAEEVVEVRFEEAVGGRVVEVSATGDENEWAEVLEWDPPSRFVLSWHPSRERSPSSRLEVEFQAAGAGTLVRLTHSGWEAFGDQSDAVRSNYESGWDVVLRPFEELAAV